jgi:hypothetical protein
MSATKAALMGEREEETPYSLRPIAKSSTASPRMVQALNLIRPTTHLLVPVDPKLIGNFH